MRKYDNFKNSLNILKQADIIKAKESNIYRTGIIGQFNLTFELSWKVLQSVLNEHSVTAAITGSPREILKLGFKYGFINNESAWLEMLKARNVSVHIYNEDVINSIITRIMEIYIPAFNDFSELMADKIKALEQ